MKKLKQRIANPMTIIAIFATLAETSAALSLPFLDNKEREVYIWFLISFPFYLLFLFFATLNFNYRSLYAPSDFEKGKHFIKVMDIAERSQINPLKMPPETGLHAPVSVEHYVRLPERLKDLYIVDARGMSKKIELSSSMDKIQNQQGKPAHVIVFITSAASETLLKENSPWHSIHAKKHSDATFCITYNLNSNDVTVMDQSCPLTRSRQ